MPRIGWCLKIVLRGFVRCLPAVIEVRASHFFCHIFVHSRFTEGFVTFHPYETFALGHESTLLPYFEEHTSPPHSSQEYNDKSKRDISILQGHLSGLLYAGRPTLRDCFRIKNFLDVALSTFGVRCSAPVRHLRCSCSNSQLTTGRRR